ncbi:MAG: YtxH domain-containing protein [Nitrospira sp.]|nr:YtxH domain-containing protein [Nitrospira sp.]
MYRVDDQEGRRWLGGEAHVRAYNGRLRTVSLRRLISESLLLLAGIGLGSLGTAGVMKRGDGKWNGPIADPGANLSSRERRAAMEQERMNDRSGRDGGVDAMGVGTILAAFGFGILAGAVAALLSTPESGASVRNRLKRGLDTAKNELDEVVGGAKKDWDTVGGGVGDAVKRTASRVKQAAEVTKEALVKNDATTRSQL